MALAAIGLIVLALALIRDPPETSRTGAIGPRFEGATGEKGAGLGLELAGGALALGAGAIGLSRRDPER